MKAPFNPFDPKDERPIGGYPSEFTVPGRLTPSGLIKPASELQKVKYAMNKVNYSPRPASSLYPGQYKMLKRLNVKDSRFLIGSKLVAKLCISGVVVYSLFFHRWNDGYDHIFSDFYRFQLKCKWFVTGTLSKQEFEDLQPKKRGLGSAIINEANTSDLSVNENQFALQRPSKEHILVAEQIAQEREERYWKAVDLAEKVLEDKQQASDPESGSTDTGRRKKWFGIFQRRL